MIFRSKSSPGFFEDKYRSSADPWNFATDPYEQSRYRAIMAALSHRRYAHAFEPGCSVGVLTERLATICDIVDGSDFSATAGERARRRCNHLPNVTVACSALTLSTEFAGYDLIVLSEIGYYFNLPDWRTLATKLVASVPAGTTILASHWLGQSPDHQISGDAVHDVLLSVPHLHCEHAERHEAFRLEGFIRR